jgi:hypothetical protein
MKRRKQKNKINSKLLFVVFALLVILLRVTTFYAIVNNPRPTQNTKNQTDSSIQTAQSFFHISYQVGCGLSCSTAYSIEIDDNGSFVIQSGDPSKNAKLTEKKGRFSNEELMEIRQIVRRLVEIGGEISPLSCCDIPSKNLTITQDLRVVIYQFGLSSSVSAKSAADLDKLDALILSKKS